MYPKRIYRVAGFTLIELLIVIAIVSVLSVVVIVALNPVEILKQGRDSNRLAELNSIDRAVGILAVYVPTPYMGDQNTIYVSLPDMTLTGAVGSQTSTCPTMGFPLPPPGFSYRCTASSLFKKINGQGWIPIDFTQIKSGSPLASLPADPVNTTSSDNYYLYVPGIGGTYATAAMLESDKYLKANAAKDAGTDPGRFERGNNLSLWAQASGLVGWWPLEGNADDASGNGNNGTPQGGISLVAGKVGNAANLDGVTGYVNIPATTVFDNLGVATDYSLAAWVYYPPSSGVFGGAGHYSIVDKGLGFTGGTGLGINIPASGQAYLGAHGAGAVQGSSVAPNQWYLIVGTYRVGVGSEMIYVNGSPTSGSVTTNPHAGSPFRIGRFDHTSGPIPYYTQGLMDEVRVYTRALSAAEVQSIYKAQQ